MELLGVVLDYDGVIAQSMSNHAEAYRRVLRPHGVVFPDEEVFRREGARSETIIRDLLGTRGDGMDETQVRRLADEKQRIFESMGPQPLYPGAEAMVRRIRRSAPKLGIVTGTRKENLRRTIPRLLPLFDAVLAQDAYHHDKPHPEPYLKTSQALGVPPGACAAVENAVRGVQSAKGAGFPFVVGLTTTMGERELREAGADEVVRTHEAAAEAVVSHLR